MHYMVVLMVSYRYTIVWLLEIQLLIFAMLTFSTIQRYVGAATGIYLTTLPTSSIKFSLYFQNHVRCSNKKFRKVSKIYETCLRSKAMQVNLLRHFSTATLIFKSR